MASYHRQQSAEGTWASRFGCTAVATLVGMAVATDGAIGPAIDVDDFRARQLDQEGGIDLWDAKLAAESYGVDMIPHTPWEYETFRRSGNGGAIMVVQGLQSRLPARLRCTDFVGSHAVATTGTFTVAGIDQWRVSNPLCPGWLAWTDLEMQAYAAGFAGEGKVNAAEIRKDIPTMALVLSRSIYDVGEDIPFFDAPGGERVGIFTKATTVESIGVPMDKSADKINYRWLAVIVATKAIDGMSSLKIVYVEAIHLSNRRPVPTIDTAAFNDARDRAGEHVAATLDAIRSMTP
jgi:hypothetical protein